MDKIAVLGAGAWGTALARLLAEHSRVVLWTWRAEHARALELERENRQFLPGYALSEQISLTSDIAEAVAGASIVVVAVPSEAVRATLLVAAGASDGLGFGHNTRAALITRGLAEMARLAVAKGGSVRTLSGLAGLGDLVLTCSAELSRNRTVGFELGRGRKLSEVLAGLGHVAEGVITAQSAYQLAQRLDVDLPITCEVHAVLY